MREGDKAIGTVLAGLEETGLLDSTIVAVVGDHGEAFGQHGTIAHGNGVYEETVHVPLMLVNARLFHDEADSTVGGMIDLAPTLAELVGLPPAPTWQGRSLFARERSGRAYVFEPFSKFVFGMREGSRKILLNGTSGQPELYDLAVDPAERRSLHQRMPGVVEDGLDRLAAWVQYQDRFFEEILDEDDDRTTQSP